MLGDVSGRPGWWWRIIRCTSTVVEGRTGRMVDEDGSQGCKLAASKKSRVQTGMGQWFRHSARPRPKRVTGRGRGSAGALPPGTKGRLANKLRLRLPSDGSSKESDGPRSSTRRPLVLFIYDKSLEKTIKPGLRCTTCLGPMVAVEISSLETFSETDCHHGSADLLHSPCAQEPSVCLFGI